MPDEGKALELFIGECHQNLSFDQYTVAVEYLHSRGVTSDSIALHKIGYCPDAKSIPRDVKYFGQKKLDNPENMWNLSSYVRERIIVPIFSEFEEVLAFATRFPSSEQGHTWWNLPNPFEKSNNLFLLDKTRKHIFKENKIYLVEGYMDAVILFQEGLKNIVALMGTNLSMRQFGLIARYCDRICICMDSDKNNAGQRALHQIVSTIRDFDFCKEITAIDGLPIGVDPDVFVLQKGMPSLLNMERKLSASEIKEMCKLARKEREKKSS